MTAAILGTPAAGAVAMAINYLRLRRTSAAIVAIFLGLLADALFAIAVWKLPQGAWLILWIAASIFTFYIARIVQGQAVENHQVNGGDTLSASKSVAVGIVGLIIIASAASAVLSYLAPARGSRLPKARDNIYFSGDATQDQAFALDNALWQAKFLVRGGEPRTVLLSKNHGETVLRFVTDPAWKADDSVIQKFESITRTVAPSVGGLPITVRMVDEDLKVMRLNAREISFAPHPLQLSMTRPLQTCFTYASRIRSKNPT